MANYSLNIKLPNSSHSVYFSKSVLYLAIILLLLIVLPYPSPKPASAVGGDINIGANLIMGGGLGIKSTRFYDASNSLYFSEPAGTTVLNNLSSSGSANFLGNVGIGTTNPTANLELSNNDAAVLRINSNLSANGGNRDSQIIFKNYTVADKASIGWDLSASTLNFSVSGVGTISQGDASAGTTMVISGITGNVGIGTTAPGALLEVYDANGVAGEVIRVKDRFGQYGGIAVDNVGTYFGLGFWFGGTKWMNLESNGALLVGSTYTGLDGPANGLAIQGNVGIGTTAPGYKLDIAGDLNVLGGSTTTRGFTYLRGQRNSNAEFYDLHFMNPDSNGTSQSFAEIDAHVVDNTAGSTDGMLVFSTRLNGAGQTDLVLKGGNVGIGTTAPGEALDVVGSIKIRADNNNLIFANAANTIKWYQYLSGNDLRFWDTADRITFQPGGNVGIGTTTPGNKLSVAGNLSLSNASFLGFTGDTALTSSNYALYGDTGQTQLNTPTGGVMKFTVNNATKMYMDTSGNVGIGTTAPGSYKLNVNGSAYINSLTLTSGPYYSDIRLKKNIEPIVSPIETLLKINGKSFEWRKEEFPKLKFPDGVKYGMIAQDVEKILPSVVYTSPDGYKTIEYTAFTPFLIEAIKEQQTQIEDLESRLGSQQKQIEELQRKINK